MKIEKKTVQSGILKLEKKCTDYHRSGYECAGYKAGCGKGGGEPRRGSC